MFKIRGKISIIISILILLFIPLSMPAEGVKGLPKSSPDFYVYDELYLLDNSSKDYIININKEIYNKTGSQVVVALINSLNKNDINIYATSLFEKWEIGSKKDDNGILILIVPNERKVWIEVGYGLEGILPDSRVKRIINDSILPYFAEDEYNKGVISGFDEIIGYIEKEYDIGLEGGLYSEVGDNYNYMSNKNSRYFIGLVFLLIILDIRFFRGRLILSLLRSGFGPGRGGGNSRSGSTRGGGGRSGGGGAGGRW